MGWEKWLAWQELYKKWERVYGIDVPNLTYRSMQGLYQWFVRACEQKGVDPQSIDVEALVDPSLTYGENKRILAEFMVGEPSEKEYGEMYESVKGEMERTVREQFPEIIEPLEERIAVLEREKDKAKRYKKLVKELKLELAETQARLEEERQKPPEIAPVKFHVITDFTEGIIDYKTSQIIETRDIDWALQKIEQGVLERIRPEVPLPPPPEIAKELEPEQLSRLESMFRELLNKELGRIPRIAMDRWKVEVDALKYLPYTQAEQMVEILVKEIVAEERAPPVRIPRPPRPLRPPEIPIEVPPEIAVTPIKIPEKPISPLPFPRAPSSEEKAILWDAFRYEMARLGIDYRRWTRAFQERIGLPFRSWENMIKTYNEFIADIEAGKVLALIPLHRIPMPWREDTEENWRYDAIVHLTSIRLYKTIDDLIYSREPPGLEAYGVMGVTAKEVKEVIKKAWREKNIWFRAVSKEDLEAFIEEKLE